MAPMAGVTDLPFRRLSRTFGAGLTTSEMLTSDTSLWQSRKSRSRLALDAQTHPVSMQIAGSDPEQLAQAAKACVTHGAHIVDINMGCPAKKVCKKLAGSALLSDEPLVASILANVVNAVDVPVTLKTRIGTCPENKNGVHIAKIAEECGVAAIAVHGRTRACKFNGEAEYDTIGDIVDAISIPVFANGDIDCATKAKAVLAKTGASAVLVGRGALGNPWLFKQIDKYLSNGEHVAEPLIEERRRVIVGHLQSIHNFYGEEHGTRIARKHFGWYCDAMKQNVDSVSAKKIFNKINTAEQQLSYVNHFFNGLTTNEENAA